MKNIQTAILLATYNSEEYLREQMDSLRNQTYSDWTLFVHDDGSTDSTMAILEEYKSVMGNVVIMEYPPQGSAKDNFLSMLERVDADYYMFCDHDDVWLEDKVAYTIKAVKEEEGDDKNTAVIAFTDLIVTDSNLTPLHPSMWQYQGIHPERLKRFCDYSAQVPATGCTMCFNAAARKALWKPTTMAKMHDSWLLLSVVKASGKTIALPRATVYYRQHNNNVEGAKSRWQRIAPRSLFTFVRRNIETYRMLDAMNYGSFLKYIFYKIKFYI